MKNLIVNGDDFGLSSGVNEGIIDAFNNGILTSASLMANGPEFEAAVGLARSTPGLGIGVHLNAVRGKPLLEEGRLRSITDRRGYFFNSPLRVLLATFWSGTALSELENEFGAQIEKIMSSGIRPTHLDTEKHLHIIPGVFRMLVRLCERYGIGGVRGFCEKLPRSGRVDIRRLALCAAGNTVSRSVQKYLSRQISMPERTYGFLDSGGMDVRRCLEIFDDPYEGTAELICHPGYEDRQNGSCGGMGKYYLNESRQIELKALTDKAVREKANLAGVRFVNYGGVNI